MRIPDANVLIYTVNSDAQQHVRAKRWMEDALSGTELIGIPIVAQLAFLRITTNPQIFPAPLTAADALDQLDQWNAAAVTSSPQPGRGHWKLMRELLGDSGTAGNRTTDAHLAAIALEHRARLASFDGDFHRFKRLDLEYLS